MGKLEGMDENTELHPEEQTVQKREDLAKDKIRMEAAYINALVQWYGLSRNLLSKLDA